MKHEAFVMLLSAALAAGAAQADTVSDLLAEYTRAGAGPFTVAAGEAEWRSMRPGEDGQPRGCTSCHTQDLRQPGRHVVTGKVIEPLAPSVNAKRLTDRREIEKWLTRNCKWTLGRECTPQEKGDFLSFLVTQ